MIISVYVDGKTEARLRKSAKELDRSIEDLAECCVSEGVLDAWRGRKDDPDEISREHKNILTHSLGIDQGDKPYRDYYCATEGDKLLEEMVILGLMEKGKAINNGQDRYYYVTNEGANLVDSHLPEGN